MKIFTILLLLAGSLSAQILTPILQGSAPAATTQVVALPIPVGSVSAVNRFSQWQQVANATEANAQLGSPISGTITAVYCEAVTPPSGGTDVIALRIAGSTATSCTINNGANQGSNTGLSISLTEGQLLGSDVTTLTTSSFLSLYVRVEGVTAGVAVIPLGTLTNSFATGTTDFFSVSTSATTTAGQVLPAPVSGTLSALYVGSDVTAGASQVFTFCDITNSATCVSTGIIGTCTMSGKNTACTGLSGTVTEGNLIGGMLNNTSGSTGNFAGYAKLTGVTTSVSVLAFSGGNTTIAASGNRFYSVGALGSTNAVAAIPSPVGGTAAGLYGVCSSTPAASGHTFTLYINNSASGLTFLTGANNYGSDTGHTGAITQGQNLSINTINSNTTTTAKCGAYVKITGTS